MQSSHLISICIPAYKRPDGLKKLLDSIAGQTFRDFDVIITDDSPNAVLSGLAEQYESLFPVHYKKNENALGTPANWNAAIHLATGKWIKLMHDDDWFAHKESLANFAKSANNQEKFIFSESAGKNIANKKVNDLKKDPSVLLAGNFIGHPSVTLHRNDNKFLYDTNLKWLVDIDFYIQRIQNDGVVCIHEPLIEIGKGDDQVTKIFHRKAEMEIPEYNYFINKYGIKTLKNWKVYDAWWRMIRNLNIRDTSDLEKYSNRNWPNLIGEMIHEQKNIPPGLLKFGPLSKILMYRSFLKHRKDLK